MGSDYNDLRDALRLAIEEKRANPLSSRIKAVIDIANEHKRMAEAHLDAAIKQDQAAKETAAKQLLPEFLVRQAYGDTHAAQKKWRSAIQILDSIIGEAEEAERRIEEER